MATYKDLVNTVLDELNESRITTIGSNTGVQRLVEGLVLKAVRDINNAEKEWSYLYAAQTQTLTAGTQEYAFPTTWRSIDWESFFIDSPAGTAASEFVAERLCYIDLDEWRIKAKAKDEDALSRQTTLRGRPTHVFRLQNEKWGVTPVPDKAYVVTFDSWVDPTIMTTDTDTPSIPDEWQNLIIERALVYAYRFLNHTDEMFLARDNYKEGLKEMRTKLINFRQDIRTTNVARQRPFPVFTTT